MSTAIESPNVAGRQPGLAVHVAADGVRVPVSRARVADLVRAVLRAEQVRSADISITFVTRRAIAALNRQHLGHSGATDIITFALPIAPDAAVVGDVYIAPEIARAHARAYQRPVREEVTRLVVHGTLHALGYAHPDDETRTQSEMWRRQERYVATLLPPAPVAHPRRRARPI